MCGIFGHFLKTKATDQDGIAVALMAVEMETRGDQSWGVLSDKRILKGLGPVSQSYSHFDREPNFVGHTRWATHGDITVENSHPHKVGNIWGVHNGVIDNHWQLNAEYDRNFDVDSQHIFAHLSENRSLDDLCGYGTIVYKQDSQWFIGRFNNGDLCMAKTPRGIFFASTQKAVVSALNFAGIEIEGFVPLPDNHIYSVNVDSGEMFQPILDIHAQYISYTWGTAGLKNHKSKILLGWDSDSDFSDMNYTRQSDDLDFSFCFCCGDNLWTSTDKVDSEVYADEEGNLICDKCARREYNYIPQKDYELLTASSYKNGFTQCDCCGEMKYEDDVMVACFRDLSDYCEQCFYEEYDTDILQPIGSLTA